MSKLIVFCALLALASAGTVRREAPNAIDEIQKHAEQFGNIFSEKFNALFSSKNTEEVKKALMEKSDSVLSQFSAFSSSLQNALSDAKGNAKEALQQAQANLQSIADDLRKAHPEVEQNANALKEKLQAAVSNTVSDLQKLAKEVSANIEQTNQKLAPKINQAYDDFIKQAEQLLQKLHEAANKK